MDTNEEVHLHSSLSHEAAAGWNFESSCPSLQLRCDSQSHIALLSDSNGVLQRWRNPLDALSWMSQDIRGNEAARWVGYLSYDLGRTFETLPTIASDDLGLPLFSFSRYDRPQRSTDNGTVPVVSPGPTGTTLTSSLSQPEYINRVARVIEYINAGDVFQVNLAQRFTTPSALQPRQIWQNLLNRTPAAYGAFLNYSAHAIISNSPELFLRVEADRRVITRPIKGTRPNRPGMQEQLQNSLKDQAELNMIVDLERNDLGRVCKVGTVHVTKQRTIESHPTVYHGAATIQGVLRDDVGFVDLLRATFPGGSITGAPKIRAMQIIEELEPHRRGSYCGAIGYLAGDGSMQFNVAIRTMIMKAGLVHIPVGGGIVADSIPQDEYDETLVKALAMFGALIP